MLSHIEVDIDGKLSCYFYLIYSKRVSNNTYCSCYAKDDNFFNIEHLLGLICS